MELAHRPLLIAALAGIFVSSLGVTARADDPPTTPTAAGDLVDRIVATVNDAPIAASDVALERAIRKRISESGHADDFGRTLTEQVEPLEAVIFRVLLRELPQSRTLRPTGTSAERRLRMFEETFEGRDAALRWRVDWGLEKSILLEFFKESVRMDTVVELAVDFKVTEDEERAYYERNKDPIYNGRPFEEVAPDVAQRVYALKFEDEYNSWRTALRGSARLRYIGR